MSNLFNHPIDAIRRGQYSAVYFDRARQIMAKNKTNFAKMQVFQKGENTVLGGMAAVHEVLQECIGYFEGDEWINCYNKVYVASRNDGDTVQPWEAVLTISGPYEYFGHLESVYLGLLARGSKVATNTQRVVKAAGNKPVLFFADRFDHYATQALDGHSAFIGGAQGWATPEMAAGFRHMATGTMPHALIAMHDGDIVAACNSFLAEFPDVPLTALVDFNNDCVADTIKCLQSFGDKLFAVRLDTSENMVDVSVMEDIRNNNLVGDFKPTGVNERLVRLVREALDANGGRKVKIIVSGGFNVDKITRFETNAVPVDIYGVGSSLLQGAIDFTADIVIPCAKAGRRDQHSRLEAVL